MKHADAAALDRLENLPSENRRLPWLSERARGVFARRAKAFLHFHGDPRGLFADLSRGERFRRFKHFDCFDCSDCFDCFGRLGASAAAARRVIGATVRAELNASR
ncbi:hypothetical protein WT60_29835 [Burkholderia sp. MSMB617WGS]|uniref:hypothetical protein n=1 Tax=Burkholderia sp. MSMB617WGS TaxID=1637831 RepID=UPI00075F9A38|nr:hypothetical protein [Burkholderia sp. MSMB617WGS]AOK50948.1 hypothetical protein WT60_29835 [Burkholderia sp. MSMB617WGS]